MKRIFDFILSSVLLTLFSPVILLLSVAVKATSPGPVFYCGKRVGQGGRLFEMFKFRTMVVNADKIGGLSSSDGDPRITPLGRFLRKFKLDELPQLINVFLGQMSFVGPRPEVPYYVSLFSEEEKKILSVKPGITDWASLWNNDEGALLAGRPDPEAYYRDHIRPEKIRLQLVYVRSASFFTDMRILFQTLQMVMHRLVGNAPKEVPPL